MRLFMLGTGPFAVPTFRALYDTRHDLVALVTAPLRTHRGKPVEPISSIREIARQHGTPIFDPGGHQRARGRRHGWPNSTPTCWWSATMGKSWRRPRWPRRAAGA